MASKKTWEQLRYFKPEGLDVFGDKDAISDSLLQHLDDFRHFISVPVFVTSGVRPETDGKTSYHTRSRGSCAVDVVCPDFRGHPVDLIFTAMRFGFTGIGYYPDWEWQGERCGGLHLDMRPLGIDANGTPNYGHSLWMGIKEHGKHTQKYINLSYENLLKHLKRG